MRPGQGSKPVTAVGASVKNVAAEAATAKSARRETRAAIEAKGVARHAESKGEARTEARKLVRNRALKAGAMHVVMVVAMVVVTWVGMACEMSVQPSLAKPPAEPMPVKANAAQYATSSASPARPKPTRRACR